MIMTRTTCAACGHRLTNAGPDYVLTCTCPPDRSRNSVTPVESHRVLDQYPMVRRITQEMRDQHG